ncbi:MAG: hypothetical protein ACJ8EE_12695 [Bradyrhizobium sp.]
MAIGSSSTAGEADIAPYPSRLEMLLRERFHDRMIDVLNRGIGGRFALMRYWVEHDKIPITKLVRQGDLNKLHMSDWATNCIAAALLHSIKRAVEAEGAT